MPVASSRALALSSQNQMMNPISRMVEIVYMKCAVRWEICQPEMLCFASLMRNTREHAHG